ncbi:MAG: nitroreductase family protein [Candidatus Omnitrophica bacterium]|nr:nitroreductase family protein [Candidatus Omnitrophota bacterium]
MDILEVIKTRRSIRKYKKDSPKDLDIEKILEAARWAPSGLNNQPWRFMVIKDKETKDRLAQFTKYGYIIKSAPVIIVVCLDKESSYHYQKDLMAVGACIQNMLLEAHSLDLGTCWLGEILNKKEDVEKFLNLKENLELTAVISLGYPDEKALEVKRKSLKELKIN